MPEIPDGARDVAERLDAGAVLDILLIAVAIYWLLLLLRGTTAMTVLRGVSVLLFGTFLFARIFDLTVVNWILERIITGLVIGVIIVFHPENPSRPGAAGTDRLASLARPRTAGAEHRARRPGQPSGSRASRTARWW